MSTREKLERELEICLSRLDALVDRYRAVLHAQNVLWWEVKEARTAVSRAREALAAWEDDR